MTIKTLRELQVDLIYGVLAMSMSETIKAYAEMHAVKSITQVDDNTAVVGDFSEEEAEMETLPDAVVTLLPKKEE